MKNSSKIILDAKKRKIFFNGACFEVLDLCKAMCCRKWDVNISNKEFRSNLYRTKTICLLSKDDCENEKINCVNRRHRLERKKDGSCFYLNRQNKCSLYKKRPDVCRNFSCKGGWKIVSPSNQKGKIKKSAEKYFIVDFMENLKDDMIFILNPSGKISAVFYLKEKKKLLVIRKMVNKCSLDGTRCDFSNPRMDNNILFYLVNLFNGKNNLRKIRQVISEKYNLNLSKKDFYKIVWLFNSRGIILFRSQNLKARSSRRP